MTNIKTTYGENIKTTYNSPMTVEETLEHMTDAAARMRYLNLLAERRDDARAKLDVSLMEAMTYCLESALATRHAPSRAAWRRQYLGFYRDFLSGESEFLGYQSHVLIKAQYRVGVKVGGKVHEIMVHATNFREAKNLGLWHARTANPNVACIFLGAWLYGLETPSYLNESQRCQYSDFHHSREVEQVDRNTPQDVTLSGDDFKPKTWNLFLGGIFYNQFTNWEEAKAARRRLKAEIQYLNDNS